MREKMQGNHKESDAIMQPSNSGDKRAEEVDPNGGRDAELNAFKTALRLAIAKVINVGNRQVHIAEPNQPCNMSASISGSGKMSA